MRALFLLAALIAMGGCCRTVQTEMTIIPIPQKPELRRDPPEDVAILGQHAMKLRNLIHRYNEIATKHNLENGFQGKPLD